jgi:large subunit ribosomal protein L29
MKAQELREMTGEELEQKEKELADQLFRLRFQHALGKVENAMKLRTVRRDLARIKTVRQERARRKE